MKTLSSQQTEPYQGFDRTQREKASLLQQPTTPGQNTHHENRRRSSSLRDMNTNHMSVESLIMHHRQTLRQIPMEVALQAMQEAWQLANSLNDRH